MTDINVDELREKAEKALPDGRYGTYMFDGTQRLREFRSIASPQVVLTLLDENERLRDTEALAVIEQVRLYCENQGDKFRYHAARVLDMLDTTPAAALRERDAEKWDEGHSVGVHDVTSARLFGLPPTRNPYREETTRG